MYLTGGAVEHEFGIAMISRHQHLATAALQRINNAPDTAINCLDRLDRSIKFTGMSDHIRVGIITDDDIVNTAFNRSNQLVGDFRRIHFRLHVIGWHHR